MEGAARRRRSFLPCTEEQQRPCSGLPALGRLLRITPAPARASQPETFHAPRDWVARVRYIRLTDADDRMSLARDGTQACLSYANAALDQGRRRNPWIVEHIYSMCCGFMIEAAGEFRRALTEQNA